MIGIDIVEVSRFGNRQPEEYLGKIFNRSEIDYINAKPHKAQTMAGIFAAKEAVVKALGLGFTAEMVPCDITVLHDGNGCPSVSLDCKEIRISISHTGGVAVAVAVVL